MKNNYSISQLAKLVGLAKEGDSQAFADLYSATYQKTYYFALSLLKNEDTARDAVQDVYLKALTSLNTLKDDKLFIAWLNKLTYRRCIDMLSSSSHIDNGEYSETLNSMESNDESSDPLLRAVTNDVQRRIIRCIEKLSPRLRAVILLRYYESLSINEIACALDINEGTVKSRLNEAKKKLKDSISREKEYSSMFAFLPLSKALASSAAGAGIPADAAFDVLTNVLSQCGMGTKVKFTPRSGSSSLTRASLYSAGGVALATVSAAAVIFSPAPQFVSTWVEDEGYQHETHFSVELAETPAVKDIHAVTPSGESISASLDASGGYVFTADDNGVYTVVVHASNGKSAECAITISNVDNTIPQIVSYEVSGGVLSVKLTDDLSGIDYDSIYAVLPNGDVMYPLSCDPASSIVTFETDEMNFVFFVSDLAGNISRNTVTVR